MRHHENQRRFECLSVRHSWADIVLASPVGLAMVAILVAGSLTTIGPARQAGAQTVAVSQVEAAAPAPRRTVSAAEMRALLADPAVRDFKGLAENAWDFTDPNGVPGFAPILTPAGGYPVAAR